MTVAWAAKIAAGQPDSSQSNIKVSATCTCSQHTTTQIIYHLMRGKAILKYT